MWYVVELKFLGIVDVYRRNLNIEMESRAMFTYYENERMRATLPRTIDQ